MTSAAEGSPSDPGSGDGPVADALRAAEALCARRGARLTPARRRALAILLGEGRAIGAYALLDRMREGGVRADPPAAYRALDFLMAQGLVHRVGGSGGYVACAHPGEAHTPALLICRTCGTVEEAQAAPAKGALGAAARASGFRIERAVIEAEGLCPDCADGSPA